MAGKCSFCGKEKEEMDHILIHCPCIWGQWTDLSFFGSSWVCPLMVKDLILSWSHFPIRKKARRLWKVVPFVPFGLFGKKGIELRSYFRLSSVSYSLGRVAVLMWMSLLLG